MENKENIYFNVNYFVSRVWTCRKKNQIAKTKINARFGAAMHYFEHCISLGVVEVLKHLGWLMVDSRRKPIYCAECFHQN